MQEPTKIAIGPYLLRIKKAEKLSDDESLGEMELSSEEILVKKGLSPKVSALTLLHECLHAISDVYKADLTEHQIECLENGLGEVIVRNPQLFMFLRESLLPHTSNP